jgi:4-amino-4-deoxy-L-arabinose transferase-like glycosyltransferase
MTFLLMLAIVLWLLARYRTTQSRRAVLALGVGLSLLIFTRPVGFPVVICLIGYELVAARDSVREVLDWRVTAVLLVALVVGVYAVVTEVLLRQFSMASMLAEGHRRRSYLAALAEGVIVTHPGEPTVQYVYQPRDASSLLGFFVHNFDHIVAIGLLRLVWFFVPVLPRWSTVHILVNVVTLGPLLVGTAVGTYHIVAKRRSELFHVLLVPLIAIVAPLALVYIDGGFNYRAPATLLFALLTGYAVHVYTPHLHTVLDRFRRNPTGDSEAPS